MEQGTIFNIQRFSVNDGPGIRTTVFFKGCMLRCPWCHNPESKNPKPQLMLHADRCVGCGACLEGCPDGLHSFSAEGTHHIDRSRCKACGACADACIGALELAGKRVGVDEVLAEVVRDKDFYENSDGGMTLSGGEPLMQFPFVLALCRAAKEQGLQICIETCGFVPWEKLEQLLPYVDLLLWDVKETDEARHKEFTGVSNTLILDNLRRLSEVGKAVVLRVPVIPGYNDRTEHLQAVGKLAEELQSVLRVEVEPYHPLGRSKSEALGEKYPLGDQPFATEEQTRDWIHLISSATQKPVIKA